jgi:hypothetical protein
MEASAGEEYLGSFAGIAAALISFCKKTELQVYIRIAEALETLGDPDTSPCCPTGEAKRNEMKLFATPVKSAHREACTRGCA